VPSRLGGLRNCASLAFASWASLIHTGNRPLRHIRAMAKAYSEAGPAGDPLSDQNFWSLTYSSPVLTEPTRYTSADEDSGRWIGFPFRDGDIIISARSKTGTTWVQMICALLIFQNPELPDSLASISPWLDWLIAPQADVYAQLAAQRHRRFIKSHTPLDGLPYDPGVTYIVPARHPLDMAVSLYYRGENLNRERMRALSGQSDAGAPAPARAPLHQWLLEWIESEANPQESLDSLAGVVWHLTCAWDRRDRQDVVLVHYDDLVVDLDREMRRLARRLDITVPDDKWPTLVDAARFAQMRRRAESLVPDPAGVFRDHTAFFRRGTSGAGAETLTPRELELYYLRISPMAPPDLLEWLHRDSSSNLIP
jgi:aryl sulfotransferase